MRSEILFTTTLKENYLTGLHSTNFSNNNVGDEGAKEEKQFFDKSTLQTAQDNNVDVKNVAVSKNMHD